jgi:hypothetical protein
MAWDVALLARGLLGRHASWSSGSSRRGWLIATTLIDPEDLLSESIVVASVAAMLNNDSDARLQGL